MIKKIEKCICACYTDESLSREHCRLFFFSSIYSCKNKTSCVRERVVA